MRILALDIGDKRTGIAVGDSGTGIVSPAGQLEASSEEALIEQVKAVVAEHEPDTLVVGLPVNMDGTEGDRAKLVRALGERVAKATGHEVHYQDERLTTFAADQSMARSGLTRGAKKKRRDALAAVEILKDWLEARR